jgi:hypothetical protein
VVLGRGERSTRVADGYGEKLHSSLVCLEARNEGRGYFSVFFAIMLSQPKSRQNPISKSMRTHCFLPKVVGSGEEVSGTPLA